ncbi:hypothetical protein BGZ73_004120 [Actinomortierella ambigua]|nr:hypothetical protein BGZ73_004120 [Actinomortierella ambigua]
MVVIALVIHPVRIPLPIPALTHAARCRIQERRDRQHQEQLALESAETLTNSPASASASVPSKKRKRPRKYYPHGIVLNLASAPVLGVLFLLATTSIKIQSVRDGIVGAPGTGVEPYAVMVLFMSLAYICISLDMTGVFQFAAFWIAQRSNGSGQRVFLSFFILSTLMSGLASNDVVVLTMTPFLIYYAGAVNLETTVAFLMAEFQTANIASMALYIGNPTNVVASQAYKISFLEYSAWMLLPCLACVAACYIMLRIVFRDPKYVPLKINSPGIDPRTCLIDTKGAIFGLCVLACSLICLIGTSFAHISVWIVTGPFALLTLCRDIWYDWQGKFLGVGSRREVSQNNRSQYPQQHEAMAAAATDTPAQQYSNTAADCQPPPKDKSRFERRWPLLHAIFVRMPWPILPFTFGMFILVEGLSHTGWIGLFASWFSYLVPSYIAAVYSIGLLSVVLCNLFNNIPMTILVARILQHPNFMDTLSSQVASPNDKEAIVRGCVFALIVGSNLGACTTFIASLAGLMWDTVLRNKGRSLGFWTFAKWNAVVMPMVILTGLSVLVAELTVMYY